MAFFSDTLNAHTYFGTLRKAFSTTKIAVGKSFVCHMNMLSLRDLIAQIFWSGQMLFWVNLFWRRAQWYAVCYHKQRTYIAFSNLRYAHCGVTRWKKKENFQHDKLSYWKHGYSQQYRLSGFLAESSANDSNVRFRVPCCLGRWGIMFAPALDSKRLNRCFFSLELELVHWIPLFS